VGALDGDEGEEVDGYAGLAELDGGHEPSEASADDGDASDVAGGAELDDLGGHERTLGRFVRGGNGSAIVSTGEDAGDERDRTSRLRYMYETTVTTPQYVAA
jgi:hypothetical protein